MTVGEAMLCGEAVACTDNLGYQEMAKHEETALLSPIKEPNQLAENIIRLIEDDELRIRLATNGQRYVEEHFTWEKSQTVLKNLLNQC